MLACFPLSAQQVAASQTTLPQVVAVGGEAPSAERVRIVAGMQYVTRTLDIDYGDGSVAFTAPFYPGLEVGLELFPVAFFARDSAAAGLSLGFDTAKHRLNTLSDITVGGETVTIDIPTRHDATSWHLRYHWTNKRFSLVPSVSWRTIAYSLGRNSLLQNSFYRGVEVGVGARYELARGLDAGVSVAMRPATSLGSTTAPFGDSGSAFGLAAGLDGAYRAPFGLVAGAGLRYLRYSTRWKIDGTESATGTDGFLSFVVSLGYSI